MAEVELYEPVNEQLGFCACLPETKLKSRDAFWDNCKGLGQLFVISMHLTYGTYFLADWKHRTLDDKLGDGYEMTITTFTMPGYSFISGIFSSTTFSNKKVLDQVKFLAAFFISHFLAMAILLPDDHKKEVKAWEREHPGWKSQGLAPPAWMPIRFFELPSVDWFLFCVVIWRASVPVIARLRWPITTSLSFAVLMMMTDVSNNVYTSTACLFLPFFVLGFTFRARKDELKQKRKNLVLKTSFIVVAALLVFSPVVDMRPHAAVHLGLGCIYGGSLRDMVHLIVTGNATEVVDWYNATKQMADPQIAPHSDYCQTGAGVVNVLGFYAFSIFMVLGFATIVPDRPVWLMTKAGVNSLYIYLCHLWFAVVPSYFGGIALATSGYGPYPHFAGVLVIVGLSLAVWLCLAGEWLKKICFLCVEPPCEKFLLKTDSTSAENANSDLPPARPLVLLGNEGMNGRQSAVDCCQHHLFSLEGQTQTA